jgi:predicted MFS family arabinose efflux permease
MSSCGAIFLGGQASSIPYLLGKENATRAMGLLIGTEQAANTIAPSIGGALFSLAGALPALAINAATYATSQVALSMARSFGPDRAGALPSPRQLLADIRSGFATMMADASMRTMTFASFFANFVGTIGFTVLIPFLKRELGAGDTLVGIAMGTAGVGAVLGSFAAGRIRGPFGRIIVISYLIDGLSWVPIVFAHSVALFVVALGISAGAGSFNIAEIVGWRTRIIPEDRMGRTFGAIRLIALSGTLPGTLLGGWFGDHLGIRPTVAISTFGFLAVAMVLAGSRQVRAEAR